MTADRSVSPGPVDVVGVIPAAGLANRLGALPCSKEVLPLAFRRGPDGAPRAVTGLDRLLGSLAASGIRKAIVLLRRGKWDIPARIGDGREHGIDVAYRVLSDTGSVVETLVSARPFVEDRRVALGFPDILYRPVAAFGRLAREQDATGASIVLGLFPCDAPERSDMVEVAADGEVLAVRVKRPDVGLEWAWGQAIWDYRFSDLLSRIHGEAEAGAGELFPGHAVQRALEEGLPVRSVRFEDGVFLDTGTPEGLREAMRWLEEAPAPDPTPDE